MPDLSRERRRHVLNALRRSGIFTSDLTEHERLIYTLGCLVCDAAGRFTNADLQAALADPSTVQAARTLLRKAARR